MLRRLRTLSGLLAFVALTFSMTEGVRAGVCSSMDAPVTSTAVSFETPAAAGPAESAGSASGESHGEPGPRAPSCPLGPMGIAGGCTAATTPSGPAASLPSLPDVVVSLRAIEQHPDALLVRDLFRPPRA